MNGRSRCGCVWYFKKKKKFHVVYGWSLFGILSKLRFGNRNLSHTQHFPFEWWPTTSRYFEVFFFPRFAGGTFPEILDGSGGDWLSQRSGHSPTLHTNRGKLSERYSLKRKYFIQLILFPFCLYKLCSEFSLAGKFRLFVVKYTSQHNVGITFLPVSLYQADPEPPSWKKRKQARMFRKLSVMAHSLWIGWRRIKCFKLLSVTNFTGKVGKVE